MSGPEERATGVCPGPILLYLVAAEDLPLLPPRTEEVEEEEEEEEVKVGEEKEAAAAADCCRGGLRARRILCFSGRRSWLEALEFCVAGAPPFLLVLAS